MEFDFDRVIASISRTCCVLRSHDKPWGKAIKLVRERDRHIDLCEIVRGGYSSIHLHQRKHNAFVLLSGAVDVICYAADDEPIWSIQLPLMLRATPVIFQANEKHQFVAKESSLLLELYVPDIGQGITSVDESDIVRFSDNGIDTSEQRT